MNLSSDIILPQILDPAINTLPYLYTLLAHINSYQDAKQAGGSLAKSFPPGGQLWQKMLVFMENFDPVQVRYVGAQWLSLVENVVRSAETSQKVDKASVLCSQSWLTFEAYKRSYTHSYSHAATRPLHILLYVYTSTLPSTLPTHQVISRCSSYSRQRYLSFPYNRYRFQITPPALRAPRVELHIHHRSLGIISQIPVSGPSNVFSLWSNALLGTEAMGASTTFLRNRHRVASE